MPLESVRLNDTTFDVFVEGEGEPLLFIHGFPLDYRMWRHQIDVLKETHQVIAPNLRGFGNHTTEREVISMFDFADDLIHLLDELGISQPVNVCGLSMGGYIAFQLVQRHSIRISRLILCDTKAEADNPEGRENRAAVAKTVLSEGVASIADGMLEKLLSEHTRNEYPATVNELREMIVNAPPSGVAAASHGMAWRPNVTSQLHEIIQPTLVLCGACDAITPPTVMQPIADAIPNATWAEIPLAGHMAPMEQPEAVNQQIQSFLAST